MTDDPQRGHVPVPAAELADLEARAEALAVALAAHRDALTALMELADDLRADAVRGLRDRGASAAQVERYEAAFRDARRRVQRTRRAAEDRAEAIGVLAAGLR